MLTKKLTNFEKTQCVLKKLKLFFNKTQGFSEKLKEKTQNSSKKLKDSTNFGVNYSKNQRKLPIKKGETTKIPESRTKHSKHYRMGTIMKQKY